MDRVKTRTITSKSNAFSSGRLIDLVLRVRNNRFRFAVFCALPLLVSTSVVQRASAQQFTSPITSPSSKLYPRSVVSGDFDGDGKMDLVAGGLVLIGKGDGTFKPPLSVPAGNDSYVIANDFNRDGNLDLAIAPAFNDIALYLGKGDGSFYPPVYYPIRGRNILAADFNNDGWKDLALIGSSGIGVLLNNGNGTFQFLRSIGISFSNVLATGDFNGDGRVDLIFTTKTPDAVIVLLGKGDGTFQTPISSTTKIGHPGSGPYGISVGDFDGDGKLDVAISDEYLKVLKGNGDGTFGTPSSLQLRNTSVDLKVADFNGDGKLDLVSAGIFYSGALEMLLGSGDGTFHDMGNFIEGANSVSVVATDLNGDTRPDLAAAVDGEVVVSLLNITPGKPDDTDYFVHQHYMDFLHREPDGSGFGFWRNQIVSCGADQHCIELNRTNVSAAFYLSIEFQQTAFLVERMYKTAYGDAAGMSTFGGAHQLAVPIVRLTELLIDTEQIGQGVVVGQTGWENVLENNKQHVLAQFVQRPRFTSAYPTWMTPVQFVDALFANVVVIPSALERESAIGEFNGAIGSADNAARARALRRVAETSTLAQQEFNRAFVLMQYFGYLRRNPNEGRDADYSGYDFWLQKMNQFNGDYQKAEMVKAFIASAEYRNRFGP